MNSTFNKPRWSFIDQFFFNISYVVNKFLLLKTIKTPKWAFFAFEMKYSLINAFNTVWPDTFKPVIYSGPEIIETQYGKFQIRPGSNDAAIISPAFEIQDINILYEILEENFENKKEIAFVDIGAHIGSYFVKIAKKYPNKNLRMYGFEPIPSNFELLRTNLLHNKINTKLVHIFPFALSDHEGSFQMNFSSKQPGNSGFFESTDPSEKMIIAESRKGDNLLQDLPKNLIVKIDVEGHELKVLEGMKKVISELDYCWLCVEDIFNRELLYSNLMSLGFNFYKKITPYNSWWVFKKDSSIKK